MEAPDEPDAPALQDPADTAPPPPLITATGLEVDGEHGPPFSRIDLELAAGLHAIPMPGRSRSVRRRLLGSPVLGLPA